MGIEEWRNCAHVLEEDLEDTTGLFVDEARDTLHTTTTSETADSGLGNALDVVAKNLAVTLRAALAKTLEYASGQLRSKERATSRG